MTHKPFSYRFFDILKFACCNWQMYFWQLFLVFCIPGLLELLWVIFSLRVHVGTVGYTRTIYSIYIPGLFELLWVILSLRVHVGTMGCTLDIDGLLSTEIHQIKNVLVTLTTFLDWPTSFARVFIISFILVKVIYKKIHMCILAGIFADPDTFWLVFRVFKMPKHD